MTIDEAIKYQKDLRRVLLLKGEVEYVKSTQLGIEAMKVIRDTEGLRAFCQFELLLGETKE